MGLAEPFDYIKEEEEEELKNGFELNSKLNTPCQRMALWIGFSRWELNMTSESPMELLRSLR